MTSCIEIDGKILSLKKRKLSTNELVDQLGCSKEGILKRLKRMNINPCEVEKARGPFGRYIWNVMEMKQKIKEQI